MDVSIFAGSRKLQTLRLTTTAFRVCQMVFLTTWTWNSFWRLSTILSAVTVRWTGSFPGWTWVRDTSTDASARNHRLSTGSMSKTSPKMTFTVDQCRQEGKICTTPNSTSRISPWTVQFTESQPSQSNGQFHQMKPSINTQRLIRSRCSMTAHSSLIKSYRRLLAISHALPATPSVLYQLRLTSQLFPVPGHLRLGAGPCSS